MILQTPHGRNTRFAGQQDTPCPHLCHPCPQPLGGREPSRNLPSRSPSLRPAGFESDSASCTVRPPEESGWRAGGQKPQGSPPQFQNPPPRSWSGRASPPRLRPHLGTGGGLLRLLVFTDADKPREAKGDPLLTINLGEGRGGRPRWSSSQAAHGSRSPAWVSSPRRPLRPWFPDLYNGAKQRVIKIK